MTTTITTTTEGTSGTVQANGIDIYYVEAGSSDLPDLVLLHGGMVSTSSVWDVTPLSYGTHLDLLASRFHVIAPDQRASGRTRHPGGQLSLSLLADDVAALIEALGLDRPAIAGFSLGGMIATVLAIRHPGTIRALVNDAGCDIFDPESPSFPMMRRIFGGSENATQADPDAVEAFFGQDPAMAGFLEMMQADQDAGGGSGHWRTYLTHFFEVGHRWPGYGFADFAAIKVPALVLGGDRDDLSLVEDCVRAYRHLPRAELAIMPGTGHEITAAKIATALEFLGRVV
jgi:pimeloyl-ACP methyl ester carboxylesterase